MLLWLNLCLIYSKRKRIDEGTSFDNGIASGLEIRNKQENAY